jgi:hypothetical protein
MIAAASAPVGSEIRVPAGREGSGKEARMRGAAKSRYFVLRSDLVVRPIRARHMFRYGTPAAWAAAFICGKMTPFIRMME